MTLNGPGNTGREGDSSNMWVNGSGNHAYIGNHSSMWLGGSSNYGAEGSSSMLYSHDFVAVRNYGVITGWSYSPPSDHGSLGVGSAIQYINNGYVEPVPNGLTF